jgi:transposase
MTIIADSARQLLVQVTGGVDTHADVHVAAAIDPVGRELGHASFVTTPAGYAELLGWLQGFGPVGMVGVEGSGVYGAGLTRVLQAAGVQVVEVDRPDRKARRYQGKSDPIDADAAARAALSGRASSLPKTRTGTVEMIRTLRVARSSVVKARAVSLNQLKALLKTAPAALREQLRELDGVRLLAACAALAPARGPAPTPSRQAKRPPRPGLLLDPTAACQQTLAVLAKRVQALTAELAALDQDLAPLLAQAAPNLLSSYGVGPQVAGQLLVTAGDNPQRLGSEAAFAHLCGVAPIPASSGRTSRHRLNRGGDRAANHALWRIAMTRLRYDPRTRAYRDRRATQQLSNKEILRCLKRYIAREVYRAILADAAPSLPT